MLTQTELAALKSSAEVDTAISATNGTNSAVATELSLKRWIVVALRQLYSLTRI
jgi:hypothetical protein